MQAISYQLNPNNAKQVGVSARIQEKGAYKGVFTRAEFAQSDKGTQGIEFSFKTDDGATADYLTVWTHSADGKELYGRKVVDAIMTCMALRSINAKVGQIKKYDHDARGEVVVQTTLFPELMNKPIGLLLVREEYAKGSGGTGWKMTIVGAYEPTKGLTPKEILEQGGPGQLMKMVAALQDRPLKRPVQAYGDPHAHSSGGFESDDDSIPF